MASTVPAAKSQPLHNFPLSHLKWKNSHQRPRSSSAGGSAAGRLSSSSSPHRSPSSFGHDSVPTLHSPLQGADSAAAAAASPSRHSPMRRGVSDDSSAPQPNQSPSSHKSSKPLIEYRRQSRNSVSCSVKNNGVITSSPGRDAVEEKSEKKLKGVESDNKESKSSKILIKIRQKSSKIAEEVQVEEEEGKLEDNEEAQDEEVKQLLAAFDDDDEPFPKTWNLRPRRPIRPSLNLNGSGFKNSTNGSSKVQEKRVIQSSQVNHRTNNNSNNNRSENQKKEKGKIEFSLTLTREEIDEDLYAMSGSKPSRRPKKRSKSVQKVIDVRINFRSIVFCIMLFLFSVSRLSEFDNEIFLLFVCRICIQVLGCNL